MVQASVSAARWLDDEWQATVIHRFGRAVALSLLLHFVVLAVVTWVRLPQHGERPLASIEISLVNPPTRRAEAIEPPKSPPKPADQPARPQAHARVIPPLVPTKPVPVPAPVAPVKPSNDVMRDVMKGVELPPDAPQFGDVSPTERLKKSQLKLPEIPVASETKETVSRAPDSQPRPSLTEDVNKELDEELKKLKNIELPKPAQSEVAPKPVPQVVVVQSP